MKTTWRQNASDYRELIVFLEAESVSSLLLVIQQSLGELPNLPIHPRPA